MLSWFRNVYEYQRLSTTDNFQKKIAVGDRVEIISSDNRVLRQYIGEMGKIKKTHKPLNNRFSVYLDSGKHVAWFSIKELRPL